MSKAFSQVDLDGHDLPPSPAPSSPRNGRQYSIATQLVYSEGNDQYNASSVPIYQVSMLPELGHTLLMK
jgi:cysteine-S-conjugate beta-lyase